MSEEIKNQIDNAILKSEEKIKDWGKKEYAIKLVEVVVFGMVALILIAVVGAWIGLIIKTHV